MRVADRLDDVMNYYYFIEIILYCLTAITGIAVLAGFRNREFLKPSLGITALSLLSMASHLMFCGVLMDNQAGESVWFQTLALTGVCLAAFVLQLVWLFKKPK